MRNSTVAQVAVPRRSGPRSCGPVSDQTRAKSALHALKHGLTATVLGDQDLDRFNNRCPQRSLEFCAIEEMATAKWKRRQLETHTLNEDAAESDALGGRPVQACHHRANHNLPNTLLLQTRLGHEFNCDFRRFRALEALRTEQLTEEVPNGKIEPEN